MIMVHAMKAQITSLYKDAYKREYTRQDLSRTFKAILDGGKKFLSTSEFKEIVQFEERRRFDLENVLTVDWNGHMVWSETCKVYSRGTALR